MAWRLHLTDRVIRRLDILPGKPNVLAAWTNPDRVTFLDLQNGVKLADRTIEKPENDDRQNATWAAYVKDLNAPNGAYLPFVRIPKLAIYQAADGSVRLYRASEIDLRLAADGQETRLEMDNAAFVAVALEPQTGIIAALDRGAKLHLYRRSARAGIFDTGLTLMDELQPHIAIVDGGKRIFAADGQRVVALDAEGKTLKQMTAPYSMGSMCCSPDGKLFALVDLDANVIRVYDGATFAPTHQRFALDLLADAKKTQLFPTAAASSAAVGPVAMTNRGVMAFAISGIVCATNLTRMKLLPRPTAIT